MQIGLLFITVVVAQSALDQLEELMKAFGTPVIDDVSKKNILKLLLWFLSGRREKSRLGQNDLIGLYNGKAFVST